MEARTTIHGTFDELETMDVALDRSVAPGLLEGREEGGFVVGWMFREAGQWTGNGIPSPLRPCRGVALPDDATELTRRCCKRRNLRRTAVQFIQEGLCLFGLLQHLPGGPARRHARLAGPERFLFHLLCSAPVLLLEPVAKRMGPAREASSLQFAP